MPGDLKLIVRDAVLLTLAPGQEPFRGWLAVGVDGRIAAVGEGSPPAVADRACVVDVGGAFVAPGFVSAHSHLFTSGRGASATTSRSTAGSPR